MESNWKIVYSRRAVEDLEKLPKEVRGRIGRKMRFFLDSGDPLKLAKPLKENALGSFRFRVGDYRIIFDIIDERNIMIHKIAKRDEIYK